MIFNLIDIAYASETAAEGAEAVGEAANQGVLAGLGINLPMFIAQLVNFAIVAMILWFLILKPLTKKLAERQKMIDDSIANSKRIEETVTRGERDYQDRIDRAKVEANKILEKANAEAGKMGDEMKVKAKKEIEGLVETAKRNIKNEKQEMVAELKKETAGFVAIAVEKILGEKMDKEKDKKMISEMLETLK